MTFFEATGFLFIASTSTLGTIAVILSTYRTIRRTLDLAVRGEVEERRDIQNVNDRRWIENIEKGMPR